MGVLDEGSSSRGTDEFIHGADQELHALERRVTQERELTVGE